MLLAAAMVTVIVMLVVVGAAYAGPKPQQAPHPLDLIDEQSVTIESSPADADTQAVRDGVVGGALLIARAVCGGEWRAVRVDREILPDGKWYYRVHCRRLPPPPSSPLPPA